MDGANADRERNSRRTRVRGTTEILELGEDYYSVTISDENGDLVEVFNQRGTRSEVDTIAREHFRHLFPFGEA